VAFLAEPKQELTSLPFLEGDLATRPPNWRWDAACWLFKNRRYVRVVRPDDWVLTAIRYQVLAGKTFGPLAGHSLWKRYPGVFTAHKHYVSSDPGMRWLIEAYLCAESPLAEIASITNLSVEAIGCYAKLFYDVIGKTRNWGFIFSSCLGKSMHEKIYENDLGVLWKIYGLLKGPKLLTMLIQQDSSPGKAGSISAAAAAVQDLIASSVQVKSLFASRTMIAYQPTELINAHSRLREADIESKSGDAGSTSNAVTAGLSAVFAALKFNLGGTDALTPEEIAEHNEVLIAAEPRASERLRISMLKEGLDEAEQE
jgi:hypothetical protein